MYGLYGANIARWRNSPDFGWRTMYDSGPNAVAEVFDAGKMAGLRAGDTTGRLGFRSVLRRSGPLSLIGLLYVFIGTLVFLFMKPQATGRDSPGCLYRAALSLVGAMEPPAILVPGGLTRRRIPAQR